ncbi:MAG: hypothetical protein D6788_03800 [Planctomycetota bacterium]|nr:MAG: hypothetical protein D6788_03800 [Planctomycetota bacterium]
MRSHEVLKQAADTIGVKALAADLHLSPALVYKWCQPWDPDDPDAGGARNPLDRLAQILRATGDRRIVSWICEQAGGFFVPNPPEHAQSISTELLRNTQQLVNDFSRMLAAVTQSVEDDGRIEPAEAERIRRAWELLKQTAEAFTIACERGLFRDADSPGASYES